MYESKPAAQMSLWITSPAWRAFATVRCGSRFLRLRSFMAEPPWRMGAERLWALLHTDPFVRAGAVNRQPGRVEMAGRAQGHLHERLAGGGQTTTAPVKPIRIRALSGRQRAANWCGVSTILAAPTRSRT